MDYAGIPCDAAVARSGHGGVPSSVSTGRWIMAATILGSGMTFIDSTAVNVVLPIIGRQIHSSGPQLQWIIEAYLLLLTSLMLLGGSLGDRYGRRRLFILGTALFAAASAWCAIAPDVPNLIAARALQGAGAAMLVPGSLAMISACFSERERGSAIGVWAAGTSIAAGAGPVLGSWFAQHLSWRWVFLINVPLAAVAIAIAYARLPAMSGTGRSTRLDWPGAVLATTGLAALVYGLVRAGDHGLFDRRSVIGSLAGMVLLTGFLGVERRMERRGGVDAAMMPLSLFSSAGFAAANVLTVFLYAALSMVMFVLPFTLIERHGYSVVAASTTLLPFVLVMFALSRWAGRLLDRYGPGWPLAVGPLVAAAGFLLMMRVGADGRYLAAVLPAVLTMSVGMAVTVAPLTTTVMTAVDGRHAGVASGINNAVSRLASLLAVALVGVIASGAFPQALGRVAALAAGLAVVGASGCAWLLRRRSWREG